MTKSTKIISFYGVDKRTIRLCTSYLYLLRPELNERWLVQAYSDASEVIIAHSNSVSKINNSKTIIILGYNNQDGGESIGKYYMPIKPQSFHLVNVLNRISKLEIKEVKVTKKSRFSFKNFFSEFMHKSSEPEKIIEVKNNQTRNLANRILKLGKPNAKKSLKVVFLGRPGSGKTTAISSVGHEKLLLSEVRATDSVGLIKKNTTIGVDYNEYVLPNEVKLKIYGTPGQKRYDYVQKQTVARADIYIILIDLSSFAPFAEFIYYKNILDSVGNSEALLVCAFTHYDLKEHNMSKLSSEIRQYCNKKVLTCKVDTRNSGEIKFMLENISEIKLGVKQLEKHYANNSLDLRVLSS